MEQAIVARPRTGWNSAEEELLRRAVDRCRAAGEPLKTAFTEAAEQTGRRPNRNQPRPCLKKWMTELLIQPARYCQRGHGQQDGDADILVL